MNLRKRFLAFVDRNRGSILRNGLKQMWVRIWIRFRLWRVLRPILPTREPEMWVFIGGCYNSGTTILREIIGAHPEVASLPREGVEMTDAFPDLEAGGWVRMWFRNAKAADLSDQNPNILARQAKRDWSLWWKRGARVFLEKSIVHGAWMPTLEIGFLNARFIGVIRNGYCVSEGIRRRAHPIGAARDSLMRDDYKIEEVGHQWNYANQILIRNRTSLQNYHEIRYEHFTEDPILAIRSLFEFIGVDPNVVQLLTDGQIQIGNRRFRILDQNSDSLNRLDHSERARLWTVIGPMMTELGYQEAPSL